MSRGYGGGKADSISGELCLVVIGGKLINSFFLLISLPLCVWAQHSLWGRDLQASSAGSCYFLGWLLDGNAIFHFWIGLKGPRVYAHFQNIKTDFLKNIGD